MLNSLFRAYASCILVFTDKNLRGHLEASHEVAHVSNCGQRGRNYYTIAIVMLAYAQIPV
jgi:hypothetical protein